MAPGRHRAAGAQDLVQAAARQMSKLPYYHTFSHKSHEPSIELAEKLVKMSPDRLDHVFFTSSGGYSDHSKAKMAA